MLLLELVLGRARCGIATRPELLDELTAFFVRFQKFEGGLLFIRDDVDHILVERLQQVDQSPTQRLRNLCPDHEAPAGSFEPLCILVHQFAKLGQFGFGCPFGPIARQSEVLLPNR